MDVAHFIIFEGTTEEQTRRGTDLGLHGDQDLKLVSRGDMLWIVTRIKGGRGDPGLCGRLVVTHVVPHLSDGMDFDASHSDCSYKLLVDEDRSERCAPILCEVIVSWDIWRQPFRGVRRITDEQATTLQMEWVKAVHKSR